MEKISVVIPCYNEEKAIPIFYKEMNKVMVKMKKLDFELIFVDDGSSDSTLEVCKNLSKEDKRVKFLSFSRNFGKEAGIYAGLNKSTGDYVTLMDLDDPIQVVIDSSGGDTFKNGLGTTDLTAVLYRNGVEIDAYNTGGNYTYTYTWTMYEDKKLSTKFGTKTGKQIQVSSDDVNGKAVFKVEVEG